MSSQTVSATYHIFGRRIRSPLTLPELDPWPRDATPAGIDLDVSFCPPRAGDGTLVPGTWMPWVPGDRVVQQSNMTSGVIIRFSGLGDFGIARSGGHVTCVTDALDRGPAISAALRHFLISQILPRAVTIADPLVLHASAVALEDSALVLMGPSGAGKSTLAANLSTLTRLTLLADDGVLVRADGSGLELFPGARASRLRGDSLAATRLEAGAILEEHSCRAKYLTRIQSLGPQPPFRVGPVVDLNPSPGRRRPTLAPLGAREAVLALVRHGFLLDPTDPTTLGRQFTAAARAVRSGLTVYRMIYPHRFSALEESTLMLAESLRSARDQGPNR